MKAIGIYAIENKTDRKVYIGSSKDIRFRWYRHLKKIRNNLHENHHLQNAFNKYGEKCFQFKILELVKDVVQLKSVEQHYLDEAKQTPNQYYNINYDATRINYTDEVRQKMSDSAQRLMGKSNRFYGKKHSPEVIAKIKLARKNQKFSEETRKKLSVASKRNWEKEEYRNIHRKFDESIYKFFNKSTKENFEGNRVEFYKKYNLKQYSVCRLVNKDIKSHKGWMLL